MLRFKIDNTSIFEYVFIGAILGYPLVAGLSTAFGLPNSHLSLALRTTIALAGLYLLVLGIGEVKPGRRRPFLVLLGIFFLAYLARVYISTLIKPFGLTESPSHYWTWWLGAALLPSLGLAASRNNPINWTATQRKFLIIAMVAAILVASNMSTEITTNNELYNSGRARLVTLNPISLGHLGASLLLVSLAVLIAGRDHEITLRALAFVGLIFGIVLLIASNSRGPIVAAAVAILFGWFAQRGRRRLNLTVIAVGLYLAFNPALLLVETHFGATTYSRLYGQSLGEEVNVVARLTLYQSAFEAFSQNLLFGAGLEMTESSSYPHNVTLEAFLATGLFGGLVFLALELAAILAAWRICRIDKRFLWAGMIVVQYVIASQFSGTIYAAAQFWPAIGLVTFASGILVHRPSQLPSVSRKASGHG